MKGNGLLEPNRKARLEKLLKPLEQVHPHLEINPLYPRSQIDNLLSGNVSKTFTAKQCGQMLWENRHDRDTVDLRIHFRNAEIKSEILDILRTEPKLTAHMRDDKGVSYICRAIGGMTEVFLYQFLQTIVENTVIFGAQESVRLFEQILEKDYVDFQQAYLINALVDEDIAVSSGIKIIRSARHSQEVVKSVDSEFFGNPAHPFLRDFWDRSVILVNWRLSPRFVNYSEDGKYNMYNRTVIDEIFDAFDGDEFCRHWSMFTEHSIEVVTRWSQVSPREIPYGTTGSWDIPTHNAYGCISGISSATVHLAKEQYLNFMKLSDDVRQHLAVPMDYLIKSKALETGLIDSIISLGTAMESLYLMRKEGKQAGGSSFAVRMRAAWHLGESAANRRDIMNQCKKFATCRNAAVHAGKLCNEENAREILRNGQKICQRGISKIIAAREFPDWDKVVSGD